MLTKGEFSVLEKMANGEELVQATPGGWWLDSSQVDGRIGWSLLRKILISEIDGNDLRFIRYYINETGRNEWLSNKACSGFAAGRVKNKGSAKAANR